MASGLREKSPACCEDQDCPICELCGALENLKLCARCKGTWYCSKEHQTTHWKKHKKSCGKTQGSVSGADPAERGCGERGGAMNAASLAHSQKPPGEVCDSARTSKGSGDCAANHAKYNVDASAGNLRDYSQEEGNAMAAVGGPISAEEENFAAKGSKIKGKKSRGKMQGGKQQAPAGASAASAGEKEKDAGTKSLGDYVVKCLNDYGLCVVDNFLGEETCNKILDEVKGMQDELCDGELVTKLEPVRKVRGDKIAWAEKGETGRHNISLLIQRLDTLVMSCSERFGRYTIGGRTKAMVACYPGSGTYYMRHVDNPNEDGRCITCIYYLNKDWDVTRDGGLLRIYPSQLKQVADIEPKFDRVLFFWSDRRNPHEVQPAYATRYAITVWYFDKDERVRAKQRQQVGEVEDQAKTPNVSFEI